MELSSRPGSYHCYVLAFMLSIYNLNVVPSLGNVVEIKAHPRDVDLGASFVLTCSIVGTSPSRFVSLTKTSPSSSPLLTFSSASTTKFTVYFPDSKTWMIEIKEADKSDEGTYYCNAESNGERVYDHEFIRVLALPIVAAYDATALEGSSATLICNGSDYDVILWSGRHSIGETLRFHRVDRRHNGTYECVAKSTGGKSHAYPNLIVYVPPEVTKQPESITVQLGESGKFTCSISGYPRPLVTWMTGNEIVKSSSRIFITVLSYTTNETRSQLTIQNSTAKDDGSYYCGAFVGGVGNVTSKLANLTVKTSSTDSRGDSTIRASKKIAKFLAAYKSLHFGRRGLLRCGNGSNNGTNLVTWHKENGEIDFELRNRFQKTKKGSLVISDVTFLDAGTYECYIRVPTANFSVNFSQKINVTVVGPPSRPNAVRVSIFGKSQRVYIRVNWTRPLSDGNIDLTGYIVYYRLKSPRESMWKVGYNASDWSQSSATVKVDGTDPSFPGVVFEIKVEAFNTEGAQNSTPVLSHPFFSTWSDSFSPNGTSSSLTKSNSSASCQKPNFFLLSGSVALLCNLRAMMT